MSEVPLRASSNPSLGVPAIERALAVLEEARSLEGPAKAEAFERFHDALTVALDEEPGD
jgi:hypothetical protein